MMKPTKLLMLVALAGISHFAQAREALIGVWELEYAKYTNGQGDIVGEIKDKSVRSVKIITPKHFSFVTQTKEGKFISSGEGIYEHKGEHYTEILDMASDAKMLHKTYAFTCKLDKSLWIHSGMEDGIFIEEHWRKIE